LCVSYFINFNLLLKKRFVKEKGKKESLLPCGCVGMQKGNGINKIWRVWKTIVYAVVFLPFIASNTAAASFAFAFARILLQNNIYIMLRKSS
jgi:uncharacterized integral membrane protein